MCCLPLFKSKVEQTLLVVDWFWLYIGNLRLVDWFLLGIGCFVEHLSLDDSLVDRFELGLGDVPWNDLSHVGSVMFNGSLSHVVVLGDELLLVFGNGVVVCGVDGLDNGLVLRLVLGLVFGLVLSLSDILGVVCRYNLSLELSPILSLIESSGHNSGSELGLDLSLSDILGSVCWYNLGSELGSILSLIESSGHNLGSELCLNLSLSDEPGSVCWYNLSLELSPILSFIANSWHNLGLGPVLSLSYVLGVVGRNDLSFVLSSIENCGHSFSFVICPVNWNLLKFGLGLVLSVGDGLGRALGHFRGPIAGFGGNDLLWGVVALSHYSRDHEG